MSRQGANLEMKKIKSEASKLEPLANKSLGLVLTCPFYSHWSCTEIESNELLTLAYRTPSRQATNQLLPKSLNQSPGRKQSFASPAIREALDKSVRSPKIVTGCDDDSLLAQLESSLTASLKSLDLHFDRKRKRIDSTVCTEDSLSQYTDEPCRKRRRIRTEPLGSGHAAWQQLARNDRADLVYHWVQEGRWPRHYFEPDEGTTVLLRMRQMMIAMPALLVQQSEDPDPPRQGIDPFFLIT